MVDRGIPKVTVVTVVRNGEEFIGDAIDSILKQSFAEFEYIVIDDASSDNTLNVVESFVKMDSRVTLIANVEHKGIGAVRNQGIELARGEFIAWQDADDISVPCRLERQLAFLEANPRVGIVGGYLHFFGNGHESIRRYACSDSEIRRSVFRYIPVPQPAAMVRRDVFSSVGNYDVKLSIAEDLEMFMRIGLEYEFANIPEVLIHYRDHRSSITYKLLKVAELQSLRIRQYYASHGYRRSVLDKVYCVLQYGTIGLLPPRLRIRLFNLFRNGR